MYRQVVRVQVHADWYRKNDLFEIYFEIKDLPCLIAVGISFGFYRIEADVIAHTQIFPCTVIHGVKLI